MVKWLTKETFSAKSNLWSTENKKLQEFSKKYYRPENRANAVVALNV